MIPLDIIGRMVLTTIFGILLASNVGFAQPVAPNLPIPDEAAQESTKRLIQEIYANDFKAAKTAEQKLLLAQKLLTVAKETTGDSVGRFVLLAHVLEMASELGNVQLALTTIEEVSKTFAIDPLAWKTDALSVIERGRNLATPEQRKLFADAALDLVEPAMDKDDYQNALTLVAIVARVARKSRDSNLSKQAAQSRREITILQAEFKQVQQAKAKLNENPSEPEANLALGRFYCFSKSDWEVGLLMLAIGSDAQLKKLAEQELHRPEDAAEQMRIGDAWWELAKKVEGRQRQSILLHAAAWYRTALPNLAGLHKAKIEKRLQGLSSQSLSVPASRKRPRGLVGHWKFDEGNGNRAMNSVGNAHGRLHGNPTWTQGRIGGALKFDGVDDWVEVGQYPTMERYTTCVWINIEKPIRRSNVIACLRANVKQPNNDLNFEIDFLDTNSAAELYAQTIDGPSLRVQSKSNVIGTGWHHIAAVCDEKGYRIYVDGQLEKRLSGGAPNTKGPQSLSFGAEPVLGAKVRYWLRGTLDDIRIYNRGLSTEEVRSLYDSERLGQFTANPKRSLFLGKNPIASRDDKGFNYLSLWTLGSPAEIDDLVLRDLDTNQVMLQNDFNNEDTKGLRFHHCEESPDLAWKTYPVNKTHVIGGRLRLGATKSYARMTMDRQLPTNFSLSFTVKKLGWTGMFRFKIYEKRNMTIPVFFTEINGFKPHLSQVLDSAQPQSKLGNEDAHPGRNVLIGRIPAVGNKDTKYRLVKQDNTLQLYINDQLRSDVTDLASVSDIPKK